MIITDEIKIAISKAVEKEGNPYRLSKKIPGVRHTTIRDWLSGNTKSISDDNWAKLYPYIEYWLPNNSSSNDWPDKLVEFVTDIDTRCKSSDAKEVENALHFKNVRNHACDELRVLIANCLNYADIETLSSIMLYIKTYDKYAFEKAIISGKQDSDEK